MTAAWRPPAAYVHGVDGPVVLVPGRVAAWIERHTDLRRLRTAARGMDAEVDAVLVALATCALAWRTSAIGSEQAQEAEVVAESEARLGTSQVADLLGITGRAVRLACERQRIPAEQVAGRWLISREDVEHFRAGRAA